jgi:hypothetical protein
MPSETRFRIMVVHHERHAVSRPGIVDPVIQRPHVGISMLGKTPRRPSTTHHHTNCEHSRDEIVDGNWLVIVTKTAMCNLTTGLVHEQIAGY